MIKNLFIFIFLSLPFICFGQSKALFDSINKVIGPVYVLDVDGGHPYHSYNSFSEIDLTGDGKKEIVIAASKNDTTQDVDSNKIFVLERKDNQLHIVESSADYEVDGRGPSVEVKGLKLVITHTFHRGFNRLTYQFNRQLKKYRLVIIGYVQIQPNSREEGQSTSFSHEYDIKKQVLSESTGVGDAGDKPKKTTLKKTSIKLPQAVMLNLSDMKDPSEYEDAF